MKTIFFLLFSLTGITTFGQQKIKPISVADSTKKIQVVETACGQCQFGLKEKGCLLAIRIKGQAYFVDGTTIDEHGDAHAEDGFCNAIRKSEVQGTVVKGRFNATYFKLLPPAAVKKEQQ
ncbi:MAG TPA: DUF6370 family protein [Chitinophagaceae bacterium]|nr:DUF6370 family protein [Chitinophagaceae bacterium]HPH30332.1 DUF6370 family protein [Chitinophagaceae bacterium]HPN57788.1 DUF6370 family protein [Chitinophagaceae bacterium]